MVDGVIVEKQRAQEVFETEKARRIDPGLVEWSGRDCFRTRVFPIPGHGQRIVRVRYVTELADGPDGPTYRLPLKLRKPIDFFHPRGGGRRGRRSRGPAIGDRRPQVLPGKATAGGRGKAGKCRARQGTDRCPPRPETRNGAWKKPTTGISILPFTISLRPAAKNMPPLRPNWSLFTGTPRAPGRRRMRGKSWLLKRLLTSWTIRAKFTRPLHVGPGVPPQCPVAAAMVYPRCAVGLCSR